MDLLNLASKLWHLAPLKCPSILAAVLLQMALNRARQRLQAHQEDPGSTVSASLLLHSKLKALLRCGDPRWQEDHRHSTHLLQDEEEAAEEEGEVVDVVEDEAEELVLIDTGAATKCKSMAHLSGNGQRL